MKNIIQYSIYKVTQNQLYLSTFYAFLFLVFAKLIALPFTLALLIALVFLLATLSEDFKKGR